MNNFVGGYQNSLYNFGFYRHVWVDDLEKVTNLGTLFVCHSINWFGHENSCSKFGCLSCQRVDNFVGGHRNNHTIILGTT